MNISKDWNISKGWLRVEISEQELSARKNIWGKLDGPKLKITGGKTAKETLGCSVSISKESKELLKQQEEEKKQKEEELSSEDQSSTINSQSSSESNTIPGERLYYISRGERINFTNRQRLYGAVYYGADGTSSLCYNFGGLTTIYDKIRKETELQYTGEELEERLQMLEDDYEHVLTSTTEALKTAIRYWAKHGPEAEKTAIKNIFGMERNEVLNMAGIGKDGLFVDSIDAIVKFLLQNTKEADNA